MEEIEVFLAVVEVGSQTAAARRLGRSLQSVNRALAALERSVGVELMRRTTRQSVATEAGLAFYRRVKPAFAEIGKARLEAANRRIEPSGLLRIAAPIQFGATHVVPAIAEFMARFPQIEADVNMSDRPIDVVGDGFDLAVRIRELPDSSLKTRARLFQAPRPPAPARRSCRSSMHPAQDCSGRSRYLAVSDRRPLDHRTGEWPFSHRQHHGRACCRSSWHRCRIWSVLADPRSRRPGGSRNRARGFRGTANARACSVSTQRDTAGQDASLRRSPGREAEARAALSDVRNAFYRLVGMSISRRARCPGAGAIAA